MKNSQNDRMSKIMSYILIALAGIVLLLALNTPKQLDEKNFNFFAQKVAAGKVKQMETDGNAIKFETTDNEKFVTIKPFTLSAEQALDFYIRDDSGARENFKKIENKVEDPNKLNIAREVVSFLPTLLLMLLILYMLWGQFGSKGGDGGALGMRLSGARLTDSTRVKERFTSVAGVDEAVEELYEVVDFLKDPKKYSEFGAEIPKGVLLIGPPGTGKTLLARAVAGEAQVPFFSISGSEFVEMFVGVGASRVRDLFKRAKKVAPSIIFIDEIDAVGRRRGSGMGGGHDEREQTLNQILIEMDGFEKNSGVIVIAATNRSDVLDPALLRPGRFDRRVVVDLPNLEGRVQILNLYLKDKRLSAEVDVKNLASRTIGFSGADLKNMINEAAIMSVRRKVKTITPAIFADAIEKVIIGPEKRSQRLTQTEKIIVAYHEAGHAIVSYYLPLTDKVQKVSIIGRGPSLGSTWFAPEEDTYLSSVTKFQQDLAKAMGGIAAEKVKFSTITNGGSGDILHATDIAKNMVMKYGMNETIGFIHLGSQHSGILEVETKGYSEETAKRVDAEVKIIIDDALSLAIKIISENKEKFEKLADKLLEVETLDSFEFKALLEN